MNSNFISLIILFYISQVAVNSQNSGGGGFELARPKAQKKPQTKILLYECINACCLKADQCYRYFPNPREEDILNCLRAVKKNPYCGVRVLTLETLTMDDIIRMDPSDRTGPSKTGVILLDGRRLMGAGDAVLYSPLNISNIYLMEKNERPYISICYKAGRPTLSCNDAEIRNETEFSWDANQGFGTLSIPITHWSPEFPFLTILIASPFRFASAAAVKMEVLVGQKWLTSLVADE